MLTKAIILGRDPNTNKYTIRLPLLETAASTDQFTIKATLCCDDGVINPFNSGDVVYVSFENSDYDNPVIIGKLSTEGLLNNKRINPNVSYIMNNLEVVGTTKLTSNVTIGDITYEDLYKLIQKVDNINGTVYNIIWQKGVDYSVNNVCIFNLNLYICKVKHTSSDEVVPTNTTYWKQLTV